MPEVAPLRKYIDNPVSFPTGILNIEIPLYTQKEKCFSNTIFINYYSPSIKVEERANQVRLGWPLCASGVVTRPVEGIYGKSANGGSNPSVCLDQWKFSGEDPTILKEISDGLKSSVPVIFYLNFPSQRGEFLFNEGNQIVGNSVLGISMLNNGVKLRWGGLRILFLTRSSLFLVIKLVSTIV